MFGDISALRFVPSEVITAIEEHIREMDTVQREIFASYQEKEVSEHKRYFSLLIEHWVITISDDTRPEGALSQLLLISTVSH